MIEIVIICLLIVVIIILVKINSNIRKEYKYKQGKNLFWTTLNFLGDAVISIDQKGCIDIMNGVAQELTGWTIGEAKGLLISEVFKVVDSKTKQPCNESVMQVFDSIKPVKWKEYVYLVKKDKQLVPIEDSVAPILEENGNVTGAVIIFRDFTEKKERQEEILYLSYHDQLTGVYNRRFYEEEMKRLDTIHNLPFSLIMADVNGLKLTNDAFGHLKGDELLKRIVTVLKRECRSEDIIARIGGDEFVIMLPKTTNEETAQIVQHIYKRIEKEKMENTILSISLGWATKSDPNKLISEVFVKAEENMYRKKLIESQRMKNQTIQLILDTLREKNNREKTHSKRVSKISKNIGKAMNLNQELIKEIEITGLMHDIGKITISEEILNKQGSLSEIEYAEMKRHPENGYQILKSVDTYAFLSESVLSHHERWDGLGYPRGLRGNEIPFIARIITIADAYEAMTASNSYKKAITKDAAIEELKKCAGTQFDADIVKICSEKPSIFDYWS